MAYTGDYFRYGFDFFVPFTFLLYAVYALNKMDGGFKINYKLLGATLVFLLVLLFFPYQSIKISAIDNQLRMVLVLFLFGYTGLFFEICSHFQHDILHFRRQAVPGVHIDRQAMPGNRSETDFSIIGARFI